MYNECQIDNNSFYSRTTQICILSTALHNDYQHLPRELDSTSWWSDHFVSSSDVTFDIKLDIEVGTDLVRTPAPGLCKKTVDVSLNCKTTNTITHPVWVRLSHQVYHGEAEAGGHEGLDVIFHEMDHERLAEVWRNTGQHLRTWRRIVIKLFQEGEGGGPTCQKYEEQSGTVEQDELHQEDDPDEPLAVASHHVVHDKVEHGVEVNGDETHRNTDHIMKVV